VEIQGSEYPVDYEKRVIEKRSDADAVIEACKGKMGQTEILVCMRGKRPWSLCFNPKCPKKRREENALKCKVCSREAQAHPPSEYCELHEKAYQNIRRKFEGWKKA
jgi:hypothetical protein